MFRSIDTRRKGIDWDWQPLGEASDAEIARNLGVDPSVVTRQRSKRGIAPFQRENGPPRAPTSPGIDESVAAGVALKMARRGATITDIADALDVSPSRVRSTIDGLREDGYQVDVTGEAVSVAHEPAPGGEYRIDVHAETNGIYRFGVVSDTHLGSKYERLDVLDALYDELARQEIATVYLAGNYIDGEARFNIHDLHTRGMDAQLRYFIERFPRRAGIVTRFIGGDDHEGWYSQREGVDVGMHLARMASAEGRDDLQYLGYMEADAVYAAPRGSTTIRIIHPGGGSAYAVSYQPQKLIESLSGGEKPHIVIAGHYHKAEYLYTRGVHVIQAGCCQDQTPFMRKKRLAAHLGGWIVELGVNDEGGVTSCKTQFFPFFDRAHHERRWRYQWTGKEGFEK